MTVVTISRQFGSYGDEIAQKLCEILNYRYFDKYLVMQAAREAGLSEQEMVDYSEENYRARNFLDRMLGRPQALGQVKRWREDTQETLTPDSMLLTEQIALEIVQKAIRYAHRTGNVVIVGRGGQVVLQEEPDALHVRVEAPLETRILRVRDAWQPYETSVDLRRAAQDAIERKDAASADYLRRFYNVRWDDPALYHVIINTGKMEVDQAAQMLAALVREFTPQFEKQTA